jgi:hypothetical protein
MFKTNTLAAISAIVTGAAGSRSGLRAMFTCIIGAFATAIVGWLWLAFGSWP